MDGQVLGNHEFDLGSQNLFKQIDSWSQFPHLAANYAFLDYADPTQRSLRDVVQPFQIYDVQGLKVGVIGLGNEDTLTSIYEGDNSLGFRPLDVTQVVSQWVSILRPQCDLIIVLSHLGLDQDESLTPDQVIDPNAALPLTGLDVIFGGHLHIVTNPPKILPNDDQGHSTVLVHSGAFAKFVGRLDLVVHVGDNNADPDRRSRITAFTYTPIPVDDTVPDDPDMANLMWPYSVKINQDIDLNGVFAYVDPAPAPKTKILRNDPSNGDSQLGNLVARAMQQQQGVEAQFSLTNSLGIRADFERGGLTNEQMYNVFPFENTIVVMYLSGEEVQATLDFVARKSAGRGCRAQAQVAGITFDMVCRDDPNSADPCNSIDPDIGNLACTQDTDCLLTSSTGIVSNDRCNQTTHTCVASACAKNIVIGENCRNGNSDGPVDKTKCAPVVPTGLYRVAVNDYIANGGSGFTILKQNSSKQDSKISLRDSLTVYLSAQTKCVDQIDEQDPTGKKVTEVFGAIPCLDEKIEAHDGRIRPVFQ
jgi:5'-nucleotidase